MRIRRFEPSDAAGVASLWQYWFRDKTRQPDPDLEDLARRVYAAHPSRHPDIGSLVAEGRGGEMLGFLGVTTTPVIVDGAPATLASVFPSVVDPDSAPTAVASLLLRTFLAGPQAFTMSDGGHVKFERIWEALGGRIAHLQSLRWVKLFRPSIVAARRFTSGSRRPLRPLLEPVAAGADALARRCARQVFTAAPPRGRDTARGSEAFTSEPLTPHLLLEASDLLHRRARLRPAYEPGAIGWLFGEMERIPNQGRMTRILVRDAAGSIAGWFVAYLKPGGVSRVFALEAVPRHLDGVIDQLFARAEEAGVGALIGRLAPSLRRPMAARNCFVYPGGSLLMVHARDRSLMDEAELGRLALSRLDGENWYWWAIVREASR